ASARGGDDDRLLGAHLRRDSRRALARRAYRQVAVERGRGRVRRSADHRPAGSRKRATSRRVRRACRGAADRVGDDRHTPPRRDRARRHHRLLVRGELARAARLADVAVRGAARPNDVAGRRRSGARGGLAQLTLTGALRLAPVALVMPMDYTSLLWAVLLG